MIESDPFYLGQQAAGEFSAALIRVHQHLVIIIGGGVPINTALAGPGWVYRRCLGILPHVLIRLAHTGTKSCVMRLPGFLDQDPEHSGREIKSR